MHKDDEIFFSIIVPNYRTEAFLEQNLNSIKSQNFKNFECLLINDGSPGVNLEKFSLNQDEDFFHEVDLSDVPLKNQAKKIFDTTVGGDSRFKYFYKNQGGTADARNFAFTKMSGKYVICVDADDWILADHLEKLHKAIEAHKDKSYPIICFLVYKFYNTPSPAINKRKRNITLANMLYVPTLIEWNFAASCDIVKKYNLKSDPRLGPGPVREDKIIKHGYDDLAFAWDYVDAVQKEIGKKNLFFYNTWQETYMYRNINSFNKDRLKGDNADYLFLKYMSQKTRNHNDWQVRFASFLAPLHANMINSKSYFVKFFLKKCIGFSLKLLTNFYF
ncbi:MAG: glycosyltransferase family 2 protein [bacterium]